LLLLLFWKTSSAKLPGYLCRIYLWSRRRVIEGDVYFKAWYLSWARNSSSGVAPSQHRVVVPNPDIHHSHLLSLIIYKVCIFQVLSAQTTCDCCSSAGAIPHGAPATPKRGGWAISLDGSLSSVSRSNPLLHHRPEHGDDTIGNPHSLGLCASMASTTPTRLPPRRAASLPIQRPASGSESQIETLYNHPSARIISFTTTTKQTTRRSSSSGSPRVEEEPGTLPCASRLERTIAVGAYRYHRSALPLLLTLRLTCPS
jgi:Inheritance of peroxisomes protein 1